MIKDSKLGAEFGLWRFNQNLITIHGMTLDMGASGMSLSAIIGDTSIVMEQTIRELKQEKGFSKDFLEGATQIVKFYKQFLLDRLGSLESIKSTTELDRKLESYKIAILKNFELLLASNYENSSEIDFGV